MLTITRCVFAAGLAIGAAIGVPAGGVLIATAQAQPAPAIQEDDPGWDCRAMGDLECGPGNSQGVAAGRYADGVLVAPWGSYR